MDKELDVPDGHLLPHAYEVLVRLSSELPFGRAAKHLEEMLGVLVHGATAQRYTLAVGKRCLQVQTQQAKPLAACPEEPAAGRMAMSSDGAFVSLVKHERPERLLRHVSRLALHFPQVQGKVDYLQKRRRQMDYPTYQKNGWPIGSGSVESGHKLVMQARVISPGMHWHPDHVNPMLALRLALCNDRWQENWTAQLRLRRQQRLLRRRTRQQERFRKLQAKRQLLQPPAPSAPVAARQKRGRTAAQYRWGRQTFSPRLLQQAGGTKK